MLTIYIPNHQALAQSECNELRMNLLAVENKLQNSTLKTCKNYKDSFCKPISPKEGDKRNLYYHQVKADYNKAMAQLIIERGIQTIGKAIEGSHNSIAALNQKNHKEKKVVDRALEYYELLEKNLLKASVLEAAMTPVKRKDGSADDTTFWAKHNFSDLNTANEKDFIDQVVDTCTHHPEEKLCKELVKQKTENPKQYSELVSMLYGYTKAEMNTYVINQDPTNNYDSLRKKLKITVGSETLTPSEFQQQKLLNKDSTLAKLKSALKAFKTDQSKASAKNIYQQAQKLDTIDVNYNFTDDNQSLAMTEFFKENFQKPINDLDVDLTDNLITDVWKQNIDLHTKKVANQSKVRTKGLDQWAKDLLTHLPEDQQQTCKQGNLSPLKCVKSLCNITNPGDSCTNTAIQEIDEGVDAQITKGLELQKFVTQMEQVKECFQKKTLQEKKKCLEEQKKTLEGEHGKTGISQLKEKVDDAKKNLALYNASPPFKTLNMQKALVMKALETRGCYNENDIKDIDYNCKQDLQNVGNYQAIELTDNLAGIVIELDLSSAGALSSDNARELLEFRNEYLKTCDQEKTGDLAQTKRLCQFLDFEAERRAEILRKQQEKFEQEQRDRIKRKTYFKQQKVNVNKNFWKGFGQGAVAGVPTLAYSWAQYDQTKGWKKQQLNAIATTERNYLKQQEYMQYYLDNPPQYSNVFASNYGDSYMYNSYNYNSSFQGANAGQIYNDPLNAYSFSFTPIAPSTSPNFTSGGINFGGVDNGFSSSGSNNQVFDFSF